MGKKLRVQDGKLHFCAEGKFIQVYRIQGTQTHSLSIHMPQMHYLHVHFPLICECACVCNVYMASIALSHIYFFCSAAQFELEPTGV